MLRSLIGYARGGGSDARWVVIEGDGAFFGVTKRLHNRLHGHDGDGGALGAAERAVYERRCAANAELTPTLKVKRMVMNERYRDLLKALYR